MSTHLRQSPSILLGVLLAVTVLIAALIPILLVQAHQQPLLGLVFAEMDQTGRLILCQIVDAGFDDIFLLFANRPGPWSRTGDYLRM
jgi:hypothetical protein